MAKSKEEYTQALNNLRDGKIAELKIEPDEFLSFQQAFLDYPTRKRIVATAGYNGSLTYYYDKEA